jgi:hypothetical protein
MGDEPRDWVSFEHEGETWLFDVTFLDSNWSCVWDSGCRGIRDVPDPDAMEGCCSFGAHFTDEEDRERVKAAAARLGPQLWQHHGTREAVTERDDDGDWRTAVVDGACLFLNRPGFVGGAGCALHRGALADREQPLDWKPEVCWQLPLRLEHHTDDNGHVTNVLRQWHRRDWGDGGSGFHSWCTEDPASFTGVVPVHEEMRAEIRAMLGAELTERLVAHLESRSSSAPVTIAGRAGSK